MKSTMPISTRRVLLLAMSIGTMAAFVLPAAAEENADEWKPLFNGEDFTGWKIPGDDGGPWAVVDGVIDCDPARAPGVRGDLWTEEEFGNFELYLEWRFPDAPTTETRPLISPDGTQKTDEDGKVITETFKNADSGVYLRGQPKAQVNIWNWPVGSGEVWGYRTDDNMPPEVRAGVTPRVRADKPIGEWNTFVIKMVGDRLTVTLNDELVIDNAQLPGVAKSGPIGLQFHGGYTEGSGYHDASSLVQFRNIKIKPLD